MISALFKLYRLGWTGDQLPWDDAQLWAKVYYVFPEGPHDVILSPKYGSAASLYRLRLEPVDEVEPGWLSYHVLLEINNNNIGILPLTWYNGTPTDWHTGIARYPEGYGPQTKRQKYGQEGPRGIWALTAQRI